MNGKNKNEEIQTRREFFKKAAKATLPVLGTLIVANIPSVSFAGVCTIDACTATCSNTCKGTCSSCSAACYRTCMSGCSTVSRY